MTVDINALQTQYREAEGTLRDAERDIEQAKKDEAGLRTQLTELGFDPDGDLPKQLEEKGEELNGLLKQVNTLVTSAGSDAQAAGVVAPGADNQG